jgi:hypothetical protein
MKNILVIAMALATLCLVSCTSEVLPPQEVISAFSEQFPKAENVEWEQEDDSLWEAEFSMNGAEFSACFNETGKWLESERAIDVKDLPELVTASVSMLFEGFKIEEAAMVKTANYSGFGMEIVKEDGSSKVEYEIVVSNEGELMHKELIEEDDDEDEDS